MWGVVALVRRCYRVFNSSVRPLQSSTQPSSVGHGRFRHAQGRSGGHCGRPADGRIEIPVRLDNIAVTATAFDASAVHHVMSVTLETGDRSPPDVPVELMPVSTPGLRFGMRRAADDESLLLPRLTGTWSGWLSWMATWDGQPPRGRCQGCDGGHVQAGRPAGGTARSARPSLTSRPPAPQSGAQSGAQSGQKASQA